MFMKEPHQTFTKRLNRNAAGGLKCHCAHVSLHDNTNMTVKETKYHELTLPSAKCCERCHLLLYPPELQRLWWLDSESQAEETEMHRRHCLIFHCDNHNVCTPSLKGLSLRQDMLLGLVLLPNVTSLCVKQNKKDKKKNKTWGFGIWKWLETNTAEFSALSKKAEKASEDKHPNSRFYLPYWKCHVNTRQWSPWFLWVIISFKDSR